VSAAIIVDGLTVQDLCNDQIGVCLTCGSLSSHRVPNDAKGKPCEVCAEPTLVGMDLALEVGAVRVEMRSAA